MERHDTRPSFLFFHMGPGFHAKIEAQQFAQTYPHVAFLDQPLDKNFSELVQWAILCINEHFAKSGQPLTLLGHSFGGQLILAALPYVKDKVQEIRLLNSVFDPFDCFANIQTFLEESSPGRQRWKIQPPADKMQMIFNLVAHPRMGAAYWVDTAAQKNYDTLSSQFPPLDIPSFIKAFTEFLGRPAPTTEVWNGVVKIYYSLSDSLIQDFEVLDPWLTVFPQSLIYEWPALGHYAHFESKALAQTFFGK